MRNRLCIGFFLLFFFFAQVGTLNAKRPDPSAKVPDGPYAMTINVFLDADSPASEYKIEKTLEYTAKALKENLNVEVKWRLAGKISGLKKWCPANGRQLAKIMRKKSGQILI